MSRVIRSPRLANAPAFSFADVRHEADAVLAAAREQAKRILEDARRQGQAEADRLRNAAAADGFARGHEEGRIAARDEAYETALNESRESLRQLAAALTTQVDEWKARKHSLLAQAESGLVELALAIAKRVCKLQANEPAVARENLRHVLELAAAREEVIVRMNPSDIAAFEAVFHQSLEAAGPHVKFVNDETIGRGGCVLEGRTGVIDATLESQLDRIAAALTGCEAPETSR